jgi:hypothetical protein
MHEYDRGFWELNGFYKNIKLMILYIFRNVVKKEIDQDEKDIVVHLIDVVQDQDPQEDHLEEIVIVHQEVIDPQKNQKDVILILKKMKLSVEKGKREKKEKQLTKDV